MLLAHAHHTCNRMTTVGEHSRDMIWDMLVASLHTFRRLRSDAWRDQWVTCICADDQTRKVRQVASQPVRCRLEVALVSCQIYQGDDLRAMSTRNSAERVWFGSACMMISMPVSSPQQASACWLLAHLCSALNVVRRRVGPEHGVVQNLAGTVQLR
jgi:hypothetical protein